jgi:hypothetical protein
VRKVLHTSGHFSPALNDGYRSGVRVSLTAGFGRGWAPSVLDEPSRRGDNSGE